MPHKALAPVAFMVLAVLFSSPVFSQQSDLGNWFIYFSNKQWKTSWNWHYEVQYRNYNGDLEQLLLRTGTGYSFTGNNNNVLVGYAFIRSDNYLPGRDKKVITREDRIFQQFITCQNYGRFHLLHRYRFEQRFIEDDFTMRLRYFLSLNVPINGPEVLPKVFYLSGHNEIFINTEMSFFDRNRVYGGFGHRVSASLRAEVGYINQILGTKTRTS